MNNNYELSVIIPSRSEMFLKNTVEDILKNKRGKTEIIVVLDGQWSNPPIAQHPDVNVIYTPEAIGQRVATNLACKLSRAKYVMKVDAHCSFDKGFDRKLIEDMQDNWTMAPMMYNLHVFDWVCYHNYCGWRSYQGPTPLKCPNCGKSNKLRKAILWERRRGTMNYSYSFDSEPHFQYFKEYNRRPGGQGDLLETMSLQGSCFMATREKYWSLGLCDETLGSWGNQGIEVACKTWLSGGRLMVSKKTWYAHCFRTQGGDFGFPYPQSGNEVEKTKNKVRDLFINNKWDKAIYPLSWLIRRFSPIPGWSDDDIK